MKKPETTSQSRPCRFFINESDISGDSCVITGEEFNHMVNVLRLKAGDALVLCTGDGSDRLAEIIETDKRRAVCKIHETVRNMNEPELKLTLYMALVKGEKMEFIAQKITELGASGLIPVATRFATVKPETTRLDRLSKITAEAAKQCGRARALQIGAVTDISKLPAEFKEKAYDFILFPYENEKDMGLKAALKKIGKAKNAAVIIGSEGGFSAEEAETLKAAGAVSCSMGQRILRAETAAITAVAAAMYEAGEMS